MPSGFTFFGSVTVSEYSANDIHETYGIAKDKISVAYNGYNTAYRVLSDGEKAKAKTEFAQGEDYFIFVGNFSFRKNIHGIIKAFEKYRSKGGSGKLLLVGNPLWRYTEMNDALRATSVFPKPTSPHINLSIGLKDSISLITFSMAVC